MDDRKWKERATISEDRERLERAVKTDDRTNHEQAAICDDREPTEQAELLDDRVLAKRAYREEDNELEERMTENTLEDWKVSHTPGDWNVSIVDETRVMAEQKDGTYIDIADCSFGYEDRAEECAVNAQLVAEIPNMLSILKRLVRATNTEDRIIRGGGVHGILEPFVDQGHKAKDLLRKLHIDEYEVK